MTHLASAQSSPIQLILHLLHMRPNESTHQTVRQLVVSDVDWDLFFDLAIEHRVLPLLHQRIQSQYADIFPDDIQEDLAEEVFDNGVRNMALSQTLLEAIALLQEHGVPAMAFKGPTLAKRIYGDLALRMFSDLDILVPADRFLDATAILTGAGYESGIRELFLITSEQQEQQVLCELGECSFKSANRQVQIDLHQRLVAGDFFQMASPLDTQVWQNPQAIDLLGQPVNTLGLEDLFLYLCIHGTKDLWKRLGWLCDIACLVNLSSARASGLDWSVVVEKARAHHLESVVCFGLTLVENLFGLPFPSEAQPLKRAVTDDVFLVKRSLSRLSEALPSDERSFSLVQRFLFRFQVLEHPQDKWLCAIAFYKSLVTPTYADTLFVRLPPTLYPLYRIIRLFRLLKEWLMPTSLPTMSLDTKP